RPLPLGRRALALRPAGAGRRLRDARLLPDLADAGADPGEVPSPGRNPHVPGGGPRPGRPDLADPRRLQPGLREVPRPLPGVARMVAGPPRLRDGRVPRGAARLGIVVLRGRPGFLPRGGHRAVPAPRPRALADAPGGER